MVKYTFIIVLFLSLSLHSNLMLTTNQSNFLEAIKKNNQRVIYKLLPKLDNYDFYDKNHNTPLHLAVRNNNKNLVKQLLQKGAHVNLYNKSGTTPLHIAVKNDSLIVVKILIYYRAVTNIRDNGGNTPIYYAKLLQNFRILDILNLYSYKKGSQASNNSFNDFVKNFDIDSIH